MKGLPFVLEETVGRAICRKPRLGPVAQLVSAPPCHGGGREFKSRLGRKKKTPERGTSFCWLGSSVGTSARLKIVRSTVRSRPQPLIKAGNERSPLKTSINVIKLIPNEHSAIFDDLADLLYYALIEMGRETKVSLGIVDEKCLNIVISVFHSKEFFQALPDDSIIINTEPLFVELGGLNEFWSQIVESLIEKFQFWDYSKSNLEILQDRNLHGAKLLNFGYQKELNRVNRKVDQEIDLLFYGSMSLRRREILDKCEKMGLNVYRTFGCYGTERDELISKSKVVINIHQIEKSAFEIMRMHYLWNNGVATVAEIDPDETILDRYKEIVHGLPYEQVALECFILARKEDIRKELEVRTLENFMKMPQSGYLSELLP